MTKFALRILFSLDDHEENEEHCALFSLEGKVEMRAIVGRTIKWWCVASQPQSSNTQLLSFWGMVDNMYHSGTPHFTSIFPWRSVLFLTPKCTSWTRKCISYLLELQGVDFRWIQTSTSLAHGTVHMTCCIHLICTMCSIIVVQLLLYCNPRRTIGDSLQTYCTIWRPTTLLLHT